MTAQKIDPGTLPADTRMMGIVHSALRRDLVRLRLVLGTPAAQEHRRRTALAEHALWLMQFLHHHHSGEDDGLYPVVVERNPAAAELCEQMDVDHGTITPAMAALVTAARRHLADRTSPDADLIAAIAALEGPLLPHLTREELEMMPLVSASITVADWEHYMKKFNLAKKSLGWLAEEAHWILDNIDEANRAVVVSTVPAVPRFVLVKLLGGPYRRKRALLWDGTPAAAVPPIAVDDDAARWAA